ncbi:uncharacterized protein BDZ99DRAFT_527729 [Mytilinidion resinicola]|uniref:Uncharacterized protein n=1 Tax=Mytilinidion resinicola TaxID=574789 RepID=A0A6A6Y2P3_9PEZI|nr:uncharacterized protein BDZ99DRAFT_527729 [Mytilinidion resinicola]KAF2802057.1 hypothetical protein BDZ99DRAFT_527729 [Mytilinidion resinicola]
MSGSDKQGAPIGFYQYAGDNLPAKPPSINWRAIQSKMSSSVGVFNAEDIHKETDSKAYAMEEAVEEEAAVVVEVEEEAEAEEAEEEEAESPLEVWHSSM